MSLLDNNLMDNAAPVVPIDQARPEFFEDLGFFRATPNFWDRTKYAYRIELEFRSKYDYRGIQPSWVVRVYKIRKTKPTRFIEQCRIETVNDFIRIVNKYQPQAKAYKL